MSAGAIVAIIVAVVVVLLVIGALTAARRRKLQQRFGPEYDRGAGEMHSRRKADAGLAERERRVRGLDIRPLDQTARVKYADEWTAIQEQFVDQPEEAVAWAGILVTAVLKDRGYPAEGGTVATEDPRLAMLHYRALFADLLGQPTASGSATEPAR